MPDYEKMYYLLFNAVTDSLRRMEQMNFGTATEILKKAQIDCEEMYMEDGRLSLLLEEKVPPEGG